MFRYGAGSNSMPGDGAQLPADGGHAGQAGVPARLAPHGRHVVGGHADGLAVEVLQRGVVLTGGDEVVDPVQDLRLGGQDGAVSRVRRGTAARCCG